MATGAATGGGLGLLLGALLPGIGSAIAAAIGAAIGATTGALLGRALVGRVTVDDWEPSPGARSYVGARAPDSNDDGDVSDDFGGRVPAR